ncbi:hypothetical protein [Hymenobacter roseosalivarius]|nr:hypothetical protein [Hymenobacter roseosalivarius]
MSNTFQEILAAALGLAGFLEEAHQDELSHQHHGDDPATCSYCRAIRNVREFNATEQSISTSRPA